MYKRLIPNYIYYLLLLTGTAFLMLFYEQTFFLLLFVLELCLPVFSYMITRFAFSTMKPAIVFRPANAHKNDTAHMILTLHNTSHIPLSDIALQLCFCSGFYQVKEAFTYTCALNGIGNNELDFPFTVNKSGLYTCELSQIVIYDFLHLFLFKKKLDLHTELRVFPDTLPGAEKHDSIYSEGFDEFEESSKFGNVSSNVTDIREYQPGDRLQKIHWKLSTKIDKLMVKENESNSTNEFFLLLELFQPSEASCNKDISLENALDHALDEAWALALELIQAGEVFVFSVYSSAREDFVMSTIRNKEDLETAFSECFYEASYEEENLAKTIYERSGLKEGTLLHVTHSGITDIPQEF